MVRRCRPRPRAQHAVVRRQRVERVLEQRDRLVVDLAVGLDLGEADGGARLVYEGRLVCAFVDNRAMRAVPVPAHYRPALEAEAALAAGAATA